MPDNSQLGDLAKVIAQRVQIRNVVLRNANIRQDYEPEPGEVALTVSHGLKVSGRFIEFHDDEGVTPGIQAGLTFYMKANPPEHDPQSEQNRLYIEAAFWLSYSLDSRSGIEDSHVDAFVKMNGLYNAWPYWREFVQSTVARMGLPALVMPVLTGGMLASIFNNSTVEAESEQSPN